MEDDANRDQELEFLNLGLTKFLPAVRALNDFVHLVEARIRESMKPFDDRLAAYNLVTSQTGVVHVYPRILTPDDPISLLRIAIRTKPDMSAIAMDFYEDEEPGKSMWVGGWFWPKDKAARSELRNSCERHARRKKLVFEGEDAAFLGTYYNSSDGFVGIEEKLSGNLQRILSLFDQMEFGRRWKEHMLP